MAHREPHILVASVGLIHDRITDDLLPKLVAIPECSVLAILDQGYADRAASTLKDRTYTINHAKYSHDVAKIEREAAWMGQWADMLLLAPLDPGTLAKMLHGETETLLLELLRGWDVNKKILMVPGMSTGAWENPMTKKQLTKIRRKWTHIQVLDPVLWAFSGPYPPTKAVTSWAGLSDLLLMTKHQIDLMTIDRGVVPSRGFTYHGRRPSGRATSKTKLPPELWTMIIDFTNDWELAQRLQIYTNLSAPAEWARHISGAGLTYIEKLEWLLLTAPHSAIKSFISSNPDQLPKCLSRLSTRIIMRFASVDLLSFLEAEQTELFWATFGNPFLPDKASSVFGRVEVLDWWNTSPSFLTKKYTAEAIDGASRQGFLNVLSWWERSGLPLLFTEAAMEQASAQGHVAVLDWFRDTALSRGNGELITDHHHPPESDGPHHAALVLKPGKSICYATQAGRADVVSWWLTSGVPFQHEDVVPKLASTYGHTTVLDVWHRAKDSKMIFDNQVLVGATRMGHVAVLEWWRRSGLHVVYKTCDVEEALEDGVEGRRGDEVRRWWARNGLNLGVGTSEWMRSKVL